MSLTIQETFQVHANPDRVWDYLTDPRQVVTCLPGAELLSVESPTSFLGRVTVKVGPIVATYAGKVTMVERDDVAHVVRMAAEGREAAGTGSAKMILTSSLEPIDDEEGATEIRVVAQVEIVGKVAQFGRGMIESVNKQLFKQFTSCVRSTLELPVTEESPTHRASGPSGGVATAHSTVAATPAHATYSPPAPVASARRSKPVRLLPLVFRAIVDRIRAVFAFRA
jgi:carbon monoxide dehydrogenase subunit G